jgi:hypothetical protein
MQFHGASNEEGPYSDDELSADLSQLKYRKLPGYSSKIPVKTRQFSAPIHPLDESVYGLNIKKSSIPRITSSPSFPQNLVSTPTSTSSTHKRRKGLSPIDNVLNSGMTSVTRVENKRNIYANASSPISLLSKEIASLSLDSPANSVIHSPKVRSNKNKSTQKISADPQKPAWKNSSSLRSASSPHLMDRTKALLNSKPSSGSSQKVIQKRLPKSEEKTETTPSKRTTSITKSKVSNTTPAEDSPLIKRLTRSTTAFNLKSERRDTRSRVVSDSPSHAKPRSNIPRSQTTKRIASESTKPPFALSSTTSRPTRSSQLRHEASVSNLQSKLNSREVDIAHPRLNVPKTRTIPKSYTINNGLKDILNSSSSKASPSTVRKPSLRLPTPIRSLRSSSSQSTRTLRSSEHSTKVSSEAELFKSLVNHPKTKGLIESWSSNSNFENSIDKSPNEVLNSPEISLNVYEKAELLKTPQVYYVKTSHKTATSNYLQNFGFDDKDKNLILTLNDHISYRYEVIAKLGKGMFGNVLKCSDHKLHKIVSVKVMKNDVNWSLQSINEIKILKTLQNHKNILKYYEHFNFRSHICISTELLSVNLLEVLESINYKGFHINVIKTWSKQLLSALDYIHSNGIIHADLKPENIMLTQPDSFDLKIIDFGSSCQINEVTYPYIQSRFYRAPEVLLGCRYDTKIDIWSFIVLIYEMFTGEPLFLVKDEVQLFESIVKLIGQPSQRTILDLRKDLFENGTVNKNSDSSFIDKKAMIFTNFDRLGRQKAQGTSCFSTNKVTEFHKTVKIDKIEFSNFLQSGLVWNYKNRPTASDLLQHKFLE